MPPRIQRRRSRRSWELSSAGLNGTTPVTTTYSYDADGNQTGSVGPTGTITNTCGLRNELVGMQGPATSVSYVVDGQGDRLREYDTSRQNFQLATLVQDIRPEAGLSSLLSDGTNDYAYTDLGSGAAPVGAWGLATGQSSYLTTDLLGSVRLVSTQGQQVIGAGAYDAWGNARPNTTDLNGQVLLAGILGSQPFGYAGQYLDPGSGTLEMRARKYSP